MKYKLIFAIIMPTFLHASEPPSFKAERGRPRMLNWANSYFEKIMHEAVMREPNVTIANSKSDIVTLLAPSGFIAEKKEANIKRKIV